MPDNLPSQQNPSSSTPPLAPVTNATGPAGSPLEPNVAAAVSMATLVAGLYFIAAEKRNQFVRFWAMQAVFLGGLAVVYTIVITIFSWLIGIILHPFGWLAWPVFLVIWVVNSLIAVGFLIGWIYAIIQAYSGKEWEIPVIGPMARRQLAKMPIY